MGQNVYSFDSGSPEFIELVRVSGFSRHNLKFKVDCGTDHTSNNLITSHLDTMKFKYEQDTMVHWWITRKEVMEQGPNSRSSDFRSLFRSQTLCLLTSFFNLSICFPLDCGRSLEVSIRHDFTEFVYDRNRHWCPTLTCSSSRFTSEPFLVRRALC